MSIEFYQGKFFVRVVEQLWGVKVEEIKRSEASFVVIPKRWIAKRIFTLPNQNRRSSKNYGRNDSVNAATSWLTARGLTIYLEIHSENLVIKN